MVSLDKPRAVTAPAPSPASPASPSRRQPPEQVRHLVQLMVGLVMLVIVGGGATVFLHLRQSALDKAAADTNGVARLVEEHLNRIFLSSDAVLLQAGSLLQAEKRGELTHEETIREFMELGAVLPERGGLVASDAQGDVTISSTRANVSSINLSHWEWFQAIAAGEPMVVGPMFRNRISNRLIFTISRRVEDKEGRFIGLVGIGIDQMVFSDFHKSLVLGQHGYVAATSGGRLILRQPDPESFVGNPHLGKRIAEAAAIEPNATIRMTLLADGIDRVISYRTLPTHNVVVSAGMAVDEVLAPWRQAAWLLGVGILVISGGLLAMARLAFRAIGREEALTTGLEIAVRERTLEAEQRAEEARLANESKTRFLATASHDLRQPLQAAGMFTEVLASRLTEPGQVQVVDRLRQSIEATNSLLTSLLDVSALEAGKVKPNITTFRLMPLLAGLVDQMEPEASAKGLSIGAIPTSAAVTSDSVLLERLLRNLLVNAIRYTEAGGIRIGCRRRGDRIAIQVVDTGIGIPADKVEAVFDDFTRLENAADRKGSKGLGLGLGVVRRMALLLDHGLELRSVPGKGSCFTVVVPRAS